MAPAPAMLVSLQTRARSMHRSTHRQRPMVALILMVVMPIVE
jgi:hypothetical protein